MQQAIYRPPVNIDAMRGAIWVAVMLLLSVPACSATQPIVPVVTVTLSPSSVRVTSPPNETVMAGFNGTVTADKLPVVRLVVTLTATVDLGWTCALSPSTMVFTNEQPQSFSCNVNIPGGTQNLSATLTVEGKGVGGGFQSQPAMATAIIIVQGTASTNKTGGTTGKGNTGTNQTNGGGTGQTQGGMSKLGPIDMTTAAILVTVVAVAAAGSGAYWVHKRTKASRQIAESYEAPVEEVEAL